MSVRVHKAVEPGNLTKKGKAALAALFPKGGKVLPKYDGVYAQLDVHDEVWSRTGERILSLHPTIRLAVSSRLMQVFPDYTHAVGELWLPGTPHPEINGHARRHAVGPLQFVIHDLIPTEGNDAPYRTRLRNIENYFGDLPGVILPPVWNNKHNTWDELVADARIFQQRELKLNGNVFDGLILRDPDALFVDGSGKDGGIYKVKPRATLDLRVVGMVEGKGKQAGMMGALVVDLGAGVTSEVGTGFSDDMRRWFWTYLDKVEELPLVEVEYLTITKDGKLREPSFQRTRDDKPRFDADQPNVVRS